MKPIRVLSQQLQLIGEIDDYESLIFTRSYHDIGEFQITINKKKQNVDKLQKNNFIIIDNDTCKAGIIKYRQISEDENGIETVTIKGYQLKYITTQRTVVPPAGFTNDEIRGNAETVMKHYVDNHIINPFDINRKIDIVQINPNQNRGITLEWKSRFKNLAAELTDISNITGIGWDMFIDYESKKILFDVLNGRDLTINQSINSPVIFSKSFDNLNNQNYIYNDTNRKNVIYVAGKGEGVDRNIEVVGSAVGLERIEEFTDARDKETTSELIVYGERMLKELGSEQTLEAQILTYSNLEYGKDYNLGDIVTIKYDTENLILDTRIIEVQEVYEPGGYKINVVFGNKIPTLINKLKNALKQIQPEITK